MSMTLDGTNGVTFPNASTQIQGAGIGTGATAQTWQDLTASRALSTTYTNSTGYPIMVVIAFAASTADGQLTLTINGSVVLYSGSGYTTNGHGGLSAIIPSGNTYRAAGTVNSIQSWCELR
jgi:hypothetical protein